MTSIVRLVIASGVLIPHAGLAQSASLGQTR
jgi:hypothetical protein